MNFILAAAIWALVPILLFVIAEVAHDDDFAEAYMDTNPFVHTIVIIDATANESPLKIGSYDWLGLGRADFIESTIWIFVCMAGYVSLGLFFAWRAKCRFRKNIF